MKPVRDYLPAFVIVKIPVAGFRGAVEVWQFTVNGQRLEDLIDAAVQVFKTNNLVDVDLSLPVFQPIHLGVKHLWPGIIKFILGFSISAAYPIFETDFFIGHVAGVNLDVVFVLRYHLVPGVPDHGEFVGCIPFFLSDYINDFLCCQMFAKGFPNHINDTGAGCFIDMNKNKRAMFTLV